MSISITTPKGDTLMSEITVGEITISLPCTPTDIANALFMDAKAVRARIRKMTDKDAQPGSGGRWALDDPEFVTELLASLQRPHNRRVVSARLKA